jgi:hypothetical protein
MNTKPWAEPGLTTEERADRLAVEMSRYSWDGDDPVFRAALAESSADALRATRADALEEAARREDEMGCYVVAARIRALKEGG